MSVVEDPTPLPARPRRRPVPPGRVTVPWATGDPRAREAAALPETDLGLAERFALWCGQAWRYRPGIGWMGYDGTRWVADEHGHTVRAAMHQVVRAVVEVEADTLAPLSGDGRRRSPRQLRQAWGRTLETPRRVDAGLECAQTLPGVSTPEPAWDADPFAVNTLTGLVDLRTGDVVPHSPAHLCTAVVDAPYLPAARSRALDAVLTHLTGGDEDVRTFLQRWFGYCLTASMTAEVYLFLSGAAESGKSTLFSAFTTMLGTYAETSAPDAFAARPASGGATPELARLAGKRFVYVPEAGGIRLDVARVKGVVGGDPVVARLLHRNPVTFRPVCKLAFTANELAVIPDDDPGLRRRLLPLRVSTPVAQRDSTIKHTLEHTVEGRAALLAFAVTGAREWLRRRRRPRRAAAAAARPRRPDHVPGRDGPPHGVVRRPRPPRPRRGHPDRRPARRLHRLVPTPRRPPRPGRQGLRPAPERPWAPGRPRPHPRQPARTDRATPPPLPGRAERAVRVRRRLERRRRRSRGDPGRLPHHAPGGHGERRRSRWGRIRP